MTELGKAARMALEQLEFLNACYPHKTAADTITALTQALATTEPGELTRSQKLRNAGYTRRPSWKTLPSDADDVPETNYGNTAEHKGPLSKDQIREIFLTHGFTVKDGQTDLKPYVYDAAYALIALVQQPTERKGEPIGYLPQWAVDRLTGKMGAIADPVTWGLYAPIMSGSCPNYVGIYTSPQVPEDVQRDAERYRWLRAKENANRDEWNLFGPYSTPAQIDAAVDAARKGE